jgi:nucleoside-diphosphate-sugar epimerase
LLSGRFGQKAKLRFLPFEQWKATLPPDFVEGGEAHVLHSSNCSIAKAAERIGYTPRYSSIDAVEESVRWLVANGQIRA